MGATGGNDGQGRASGHQRLALLLFGTALALLFIGFAVAQGIGTPSVPSGDVALVQGVPDEFAAVSEAAFDHAMEQQVAQAKLKSPPAAGGKRYEEMKEAALGELLDQIWIKGEAEELGIEATPEQVEEKLAEVKKQSFPAKGSYQQFLEESKFTKADVDDRLELQILTGAIQKQVNGEAPKPSSSEVKDYYEREKTTQFTEKESADVRVILNKDKAKVEAAKKSLAGDSSQAAWKATAKKYSSDPTSSAKGGLIEGVTEEFLKEPVKKAIFGAAVGELVGPLKFEGNYVLVEVVKLNEAKAKPLGEVEAQIEETLGHEKQEEFFKGFIRQYQTKWASRTYCADGFVDNRCANNRPSGHPKDAPPACYEADPKAPANACPAPVTPISPALPGTVSEQNPQGEPLPQRPVPAGSSEGTATPEASTGAVPAGE